ncbi:hypothetical protein BVC93_15900 [Mycobacterium sp. MS1601]|uniref:hypothetical protein n=1 Tax=Mycobacterium sp. MS1601 TaxID=1936029 RepID=UPI0009796AA2|nr:hypothetical protein [Mycobacterium sp. MS1601]AQA03654.1 hypothetical protein BVC93_15900 [Mycobacterium sp. MS1601]
MLFWAGVAVMAVGSVGGFYPLWKSANLSPDAIQRRVYWSACPVVAVLFFLSQLPDWRSGLFFGLGSALALVAIAFNWTGHIKIRGRIYAAFPDDRRPDRPPALRGESD